MFDYVGKSRPIGDAIDKVTGSLKYVADEKRSGMLYGRMLLSDRAHARILSIDTSEAEALPGVRAVATCFNSPHTAYNSAKRYINSDHMTPDEYMLQNVVRYYGDRVAAVAADTDETAQKAVRLIKVKYEDLPVILDPEQALSPGAYPIHEAGNLISTFHAAAGDAERALQKADYVIEGRYTAPSVCHVCMEPHATLAEWSHDSIRVWTPTQAVFTTRMNMAAIFNMPMNRIRMAQTPVGGSFGGKGEMTLEPVAAWLSKLAGGKPVLLNTGRRESFISTRTRHAAVMYIKAAVMRDGTITALKFNYYLNGGAYATSSMNLNACMGSKSMMLYRVQNMDFTGHAVYTNAPMASGMRGYGSPQAALATEMLMDKIAAVTGIDPVQLRLKNLARPGDVQPCNGVSLGNVRVRECLTDVVKASGWAQHQGVEVDGDVRRAWGFACGVHGNGVYPQLDPSVVYMRMMEDGSITIYASTHELGQGLIRVITIIAGEVLRVAPESFSVVTPNTDYTGYSMGEGASRGAWVSGSAVKGAAEMLLALIKEEAGKLLDAPAAELELAPGGCVYLKGHPERKASYGEVALYAQQVSQRGELFVSNPYYSHSAPGTYVADLAQVAVNTLTGEVKVEKFYATHDAGRVLNPMMIEGQIQGGLQMGLGYALREELRLDPTTGSILNASLKKYRIFKAAEMPELVINCIEDGAQEDGPFGAKSCSEIAVVGVAPAILNAINRALGMDTHPEVQLCDLPAKPERILKAVEKAKALGAIRL